MSSCGPLRGARWKRKKKTNEKFLTTVRLELATVRFVVICQIYPTELEIKDRIDSNTSASYLDLLLLIGRYGQLRTALVFMTKAYDLFISQLIWYARACSSYECCILRAARRSCKLLGQGCVRKRLYSFLRKFNGRYWDPIKHYEVPLSLMLHDVLGHDHIQWYPPLIRYFT